MEAFTVFMLKFLERKIKVLLCLKMEKTKQGIKSEEFCRVLFRKRKRNGNRNERLYRKNGDVGK